MGIHILIQCGNKTQEMRLKTKRNCPRAVACMLKSAVGRGGGGGSFFLYIEGKICQIKYICSELEDCELYNCFFAAFV
jgi:hypothetical protein